MFDIILTSLLLVLIVLGIRQLIMMIRIRRFKKHFLDDFTEELEKIMEDLED